MQTEATQKAACGRQWPESTTGVLSGPLGSHAKEENDDDGSNGEPKRRIEVSSYHYDLAGFSRTLC